MSKRDIERIENHTALIKYPKGLELEENDQQSTASFLNLYIKEINGITQLTPEETKDYIDKAKKGDAYAINQLLETNLKLVLNIVLSKFKSFCKNDSDVIDLIHEGCLALRSAIVKYNDDKGTDLGFWCRLYVENHLKKETAKASFFPVHMLWVKISI